MANRTHERLLSPLLTHMQWHIPMGRTHMPSPTCRASWLRAPETQHTPCSEQMRALLHKCQLLTRKMAEASTKLHSSCKGVETGEETQLSNNHLNLISYILWVKNLTEQKSILNIFFLTAILPLLFWMNTGAHFLWKDYPNFISDIYVCVCVCVYVYIYIYIYTHTLHRIYSDAIFKTHSWLFVCVSLFTCEWVYDSLCPLWVLNHSRQECGWGWGGGVEGEKGTSKMEALRGHESPRILAGVWVTRILLHT